MGVNYIGAKRVNGSYKESLAHPPLLTPEPYFLNFLRKKILIVLGSSDPVS
jgi:hypothetical protein